MSDILHSSSVKLKTDFNVYILSFYNLLESLNMIDKFKEIFSKNDGITYDNKNILIREMRNSRKVPREQQKMILFEQMFACKQCKLQTFDIEVDHIQPLFMGGNNRRENLQGLCRLCHGLKSAEERVSLDECIDYMYRDFLSEIKELRKEDQESIKTTTIVNKIDSIDDNEIKTSISDKSMIINTRLQKYKCEICFKQYQDRSGIRKHKLTDKCITPQAIIVLKNDVKKLEEENKYLKNSELNLKTDITNLKEEYRCLKDSELKLKTDITKLEDSEFKLKTDVTKLEDENGKKSLKILEQQNENILLKNIIDLFLKKH